ncbi:unnamed protein product [Urochloa decumbens]|uniref:Uncharacterized protein n=1 Tax=Urochloa decumbens TaxID=240449 RepID=A0ABC9FNA5_9POAL
MGLPAPPTSSVGKESARAHLVVARAGAAPAWARTGTVSAALRPSSLPLAAAGAARLGGGGRGGGERGGGGASRLAGAAVYTSLRRPVAPAIKASPFFPSYGTTAVLCRARHAGIEGDGERGAGAGGEGDGDGGGVEGAGVDDHGNGGDGYNGKKDCAFDQGKGAEEDPRSAPAGGGGAGGDRRNAEKAGNFAKVPDAEEASGGGGGGDRAHQACWERMLLRWALIQGVVTVFLLGFSVYIAFMLCFDTIVRKVATKYLKDDELRMLVAEAVKDVSYRVTEPINPIVQWKKLSKNKKLSVYCGVLYVFLYFIL